MTRCCSSTTTRAAPSSRGVEVSGKPGGFCLAGLSELTGDINDEGVAPLDAASFALAAAARRRRRRRRLVRRPRRGAVDGRPVRTRAFAPRLPSPRFEDALGARGRDRRRRRDGVGLFPGVLARDDAAAKRHPIGVGGFLVARSRTGVMGVGVPLRADRRRRRGAPPPPRRGRTRTSRRGRRAFSAKRRGAPRGARRNTSPAALASLRVGFFLRVVAELRAERRRRTQKAQERASLRGFVLERVAGHVPEARRPYREVRGVRHPRDPDAHRGEVQRKPRIGLAEEHQTPGPVHGQEPGGDFPSRSAQRRVRDARRRDGRRRERRRGDAHARGDHELDAAVFKRLRVFTPRRRGEARAPRRRGGKTRRRRHETKVVVFFFFFFFFFAFLSF